MVKLKPKAGTSLDEKETHIYESVYHLGNVYEMYTTDPVWMRRAEKMLNNYPDEVKLVRDDAYGITIQYPRDSFTMEGKHKRKRVMTEEQREAARERFKKVREMKRA